MFFQDALPYYWRALIVVEKGLTPAQLKRGCRHNLTTGVEIEVVAVALAFDALLAAAAGKLSIG